MNESNKQLAHEIIRDLRTSLNLLSDLEQKSYRTWLAKIEKRLRQKLPVDRSLDKLKIQLSKRVEFVKQRIHHSPKISYPEILPITEHVKEITEAINEHQVIIIAGETGSGKTTQIPKICLAMGRGIYGQIGHTQPRRLAARSVAARIAEELNVPLGKQVGYQVRFDDRSDVNGYVKLMTDGILLNELHHDPLLKKYDTLIIDEAHERSLNIDFILGILHQLLRKRPDLKVIITSATIDPERFSRHFNDAPVIEVSGRTYPVETLYMPLSDVDDDSNALLLEEGVSQAAELLIAQGPGDILVFLPGEQDIRHIADYLRRHLQQTVEVLPLYSRLAQSDQMKIFSPSKNKNPRIILSTNVAETSLTVPGIHYVIDSGKARISRYSVRSKIQRLPIENISQASANQRQGRCGRIANGICVRLYSEDDFNTRSEFTDPEIKRTNLASVILQMSMLELGSVEDFDFLEPPDNRVINDGYKLLEEIGAMSASRKISKLGKQLAILPVDPKLGRILLAGSEMSALNEILIITAAMSLPDPRERPVDKQQQADEKHLRFLDADSDFVALLNLWDYFGETKQTMSWNQLRKVCQKEFLNFNRMREWREIYAQLKRLMLEQKHKLNKNAADYDAIHKALLAGLVSQIGEKTSDGDYQSTRQNRFYIFPGSGLFKKHNKKQSSDNEDNTKEKQSTNIKWLLAGELVETQKLYARQVAKIDPAWVEIIAPHLLKHQYSEPYWSRKAGRPMVKENVTLYGLTVIANRTKALAHHDAQRAHELFVYHAFVENDYITRATAIVHNRKCLEQVEAMEHRARRRDILVEQDQLEEFYSDKIPNNIHNGPAFEKWYQKASPQMQKSLQFSVDDLIREEAEEIDRIAYPETLTVNDIDLELEYHFEPGAVDDGLHIILPIAYINKFNSKDFDSLVPGMLKDKIIALLRGLPKVLRKNFVPVPDYAKALTEKLSIYKGQRGVASLTELLAKHLKQMTAVLIEPNDFQQQDLPENLKPLFYLTDMETGQVIDTSRSLIELQQKYADSALDFLNEDHGLELYQEYPDCGLDNKLQSSHGDKLIDLFSGIAIVDDNVVIKTFDNERQAELDTQESLKLLSLKKSSKMIKEMKKNLPELVKAELSYATLKKSDSAFFSQQQSALYIDLFLLICDIKIADQALSCSSTVLFEKLHSRIRQDLLPDIIEHIKLLVEIFRQAEIVRRNLLHLPSNSLIEVASIIQSRLETLMYTGFISNTGWEQLHHYPRYLKALAIRFERAELNPQAERERTEVWDKWWHKYSQISADYEILSAKKDFRWLLEEFHVSLFAQQLGTKRSVSEKRLSVALEQLH